jgi:hypothetical protein
MSPTPAPTPAVATGLIVRQTGQPVALDHVRVDARVADLCARVTVRQCYRNREEVPLEVVYVFPLRVRGHGGRGALRGPGDGP